jgi:hypothetical protein
MNRIKLAYFLIFASLILLVLNISELDFENLKQINIQVLAQISY